MENSMANRVRFTASGIVDDNRARVNYRAANQRNDLLGKLLYDFSAGEISASSLSARTIVKL